MEYFFSDLGLLIGILIIIKQMLRRASEAGIVLYTSGYENIYLTKIFI